MFDLSEIPGRAASDARIRRSMGMKLSTASLASTARTLVLATATLATLSCSYNEMLRKITPADADARAREYLGLLSRRQTDSAMARLIREIQGPATRQQVVNVIGIFDGEHFDSIRVIGANTWSTAAARRVNLTYELHSPNGWFEANVAIFIGTRKGMPRRWGWVAMALLGYGTFAMNWSTGEWSYNLLSVRLLGAGYTRAGLYAPYVFAFSIPLGSALALERYRRWKTRRVSPNVPVAVA